MNKLLAIKKCFEDAKIEQSKSISDHNKISFKTNLSLGEMVLDIGFLSNLKIGETFSCEMQTKGPFELKIANEKIGLVDLVKADRGGFELKVVDLEF